MCLPYSLTRYSCRQYLEDHVVKELNERGTQHKFGEDLFKATQYLTPIVWSAINEVVVGARAIMKFLKTISRLVASENLPVCWTTPLGFPVQMMCYKKESKRVKTKMGDSIVKLSIASESEEIDKIELIPEICIKGTGYIFCYQPDSKSFVKIDRGQKALIMEERKDTYLIYTFDGFLIEIDKDEILATGFD